MKVTGSWKKVFQRGRPWPHCLGPFLASSAWFKKSYNLSWQGRHGGGTRKQQFTLRLQSGSGEWAGRGLEYEISKPSLSDSLSSARLCLLEVPQLSKTAPPAGNPALKTHKPGRDTSHSSIFQATGKEDAVL